MYAIWEDGKNSIKNISFHLRSKVVNWYFQTSLNVNSSNNAENLLQFQKTVLFMWYGVRSTLHIKLG
ncbi:MAG: hypothetical protein CM15mP66_10390 [Pseudomonadota bacterium]|nr:MAG: hypothetical protein CM15mP66_10390 [Pseudomonadota bacterium]